MSTLSPFSDDEIFLQISYIIEQFRLSREEWIADFYCAIGEFTIEEIESF